MKIISKLSFTVYAVLYSSWSFAVVEEPGSFEMGGITVTPLVKAGVGYDDNVYREGEGDLKEKGSVVYHLNPSVEFKAESGMSYYLLNLAAENKTFSSEKDQGFTNVGANLDLNHEFNSRNRLQVTGGYGIEHDQGSVTDKDKDNL